MNEDQVLRAVIAGLIVAGLGGLAMIVGILGDHPRVFVVGALALLGTAMMAVGLVFRVLVDAIRNKD